MSDIIFWTNEKDSKDCSIYVEIFKEIVSTVLKHEPILFTPDESFTFRRFAALDYPAQYLLVRLSLRKLNKWHRLDALKYRAELGDGIVHAIADLCVPFDAGHEIIDLTRDGDAPDGLTVFAYDDRSMSLSDLLACLTVDELRGLAKQAKLRTMQSRSALVAALLTSAATQSTLDFPVLPKSPSKPLLQTRLSFPVVGKGTLVDKGKAPQPKPQKTQEERLRELATSILGKCIRLNPLIYKLFKRVDLVYFRSTESTPTLLTPALLTRFKKRAYPAYVYTRTADIWRTREELIQYEEALELEATLDAIDEGEPKGKGRPPPGHESVTPGGEEQPPQEQAVPQRVLAARRAKALFETDIFPRWQALVRAAEAQASARTDTKRAGLERFDCGFIYTRMVQRCAHALAVLKEHAAELAVLDSLLAQRIWRRGRRGRWHDRRALILMVHSETKKEPQTLARTLDGVRAGLADEDTHMVYRPALLRRLTRLEKMLKVPPDERSVAPATLRKPVEVYVEGVRIRRASSSGDATGKSIWRGRDAEVSVEGLALQHYEGLGYKGFHSEGALPRTLFGLLFWDVLFAPVPGAFETPYQAAPLDIADDAFVRARAHLIGPRLAELRAGGARALLERVDGAQRERGTWCVGVRWDLFARADLVEIVECLGGAALAAMCTVLCEDYAQRGSGVPDLFVWDAAARACKFVEVKGPGDALQENQKIWIDVLLGAGVGVEVCKVVERGTKKAANTGKGKGKGKAAEDGDAGAGHDTSSAKPRGTKRRHVDDEFVLASTSNLDRPSAPHHRVEVLITTPSPANKRRLDYIPTS